MKIDTEQKKEILDQIEQNEVIYREDVEMEQIDNDAEEDNIADRKLLSLSTEQKSRLKKEVFDLFEAIKAERKENESKWDMYDAQYSGEMDDKSMLEFTLNVPVTQVKVDSIERLAAKAFLESDPKFNVSLRPEAVRESMSNKDINRIEKSQAEYLDYQLDERINIASPLRQVLHQSAKLEGGLMKVPYVYKRKKKVREEFYRGRRTVNDDGQEVPEGLQAFVQNYPKAIVPGEVGHNYFQKLMRFEDVRIKVEFWEAVYDDAKPTFVDQRDFYVRKSCEGYAGLCDEQFYAERTRYTYWEMEKEEQAGNMESVKDAQYVDCEKGDIDSKYLVKEHEILEVTYWFKMDPDDREETKIICLFNEHNRAFHGAYLYPYDLVECIYVPFYIKNKKKGFYKGGLSEDLTDSHLAQNAMLNLMLTECWQRLTTTPIVRDGSRTADQFLAGKWKNGIPIIVDREESIKENFGILDKPNAANALQLINLLQWMAQYDDKRTGISSLASGQETPYDPNAPAAKTAMLLKQTGINVEDYINCLLPSFNKVAEIVLKHSYQAATDGSRKYRQKQRARRVSGKDAYSSISRDDMIAETTIESRAAGFAFDKINEKNENLAIYQLLRNEPIIARNPKAVHNMVHSLLESWSPMWKAKADNIALDVEQMDQEVMKAGIKALNVYMKQLSQAANMQGGQVKPQIGEYLQITAELMAQAVNPQPEQKQGENGQ